MLSLADDHKTVNTIVNTDIYMESMSSQFRFPIYSRNVLLVIPKLQYMHNTLQLRATPRKHNELHITLRVVISKLY